MVSVLSKKKLRRKISGVFFKTEGQVDPILFYLYYLTMTTGIERCPSDVSTCNK